MALNKIVARAKKQPPRCLAGFQVRTDTELTARTLRTFWNDTDDAVAFELLAPSPVSRPVLLGHYLDKDWPDGRGRIMVSPLAIRWMPSGEVVPLFDGEQHGYNPEYSLGRVHALSPNSQAVWTSPEGLRDDLLFIACFSYNPSDQFYMETDEVMQPHPQDFFEMFLLAAYCQEKDTVVFVTEFECA